MQLISSAFKHNGMMPAQYTCDGLDINPELFIKDVPQGTKSLALIMDDPDAVKPAGKVWDHWIVWNIPPDITDISEGIEPPGVHGKGTSDNLDYHGPCPPDGEHAYVFALYALDTMLDLPEGSSKQVVLHALEGHIIEKAILIGKYTRVSK